MSASDVYFQFPLCLLAIGKEEEPWRDRIDAVLGHSIIEFGLSNNALSHDDVDRFARGLSISRPDEEVMAELRRRLKFTGGSMRGLVTEWMRCDRFLSDYKKTFPSSVGLVRIRADLCWDAKNDAGLTERQFRVLAAVYSVLGNKPFSQVTREQIIYRAAGCVSRKVFEGWASRSEPYTEKEIRTTIATLEAKHLFRTCVFRRRQKFFTNRLSEADLYAQVIQFKTSTGSAAAALKRQKDDEMTRQILAIRAAQRGTT